MRNTFAVLLLLSVHVGAYAVACQPAGNLVPPMLQEWDADALDPDLALVAEQFRIGGDWEDTADRHGVLFRKSENGSVQLLFELAEFGQRVPPSGRDCSSVGPTIAERLRELRRDFTTLDWMTSGSPTFQRGWISPTELQRFHRSVLLELPLATTSKWVAPVVATYGSTVSQGPLAMRAHILEELGTRGAGIKIAVFDLGFGGIASTAAAETGSVSTHPSQSLASLDADTEVHGTACVEIIRDMAPDAQILVIREDVSMDVGTAASYATSWGADVISRSVNDFFYPGVGPACQAATTAISAGIEWVNSAGNAASGHYWESSTYTVGASGFVRFSGVVEVNQLSVPAIVGSVSVHLSYEAPTASFAHYQLCLYEDAGTGLTLVGTGMAGSPYLQAVSYTPSPGASYYVAVYQTSTGTLGRMRLSSSWSTTYTYQYSNSYGSVMNPATLTSVVSVGAVSQANYTSSGAPEAYSSRGGGIFNLPLALCAPTDCSTVSVTSFNGTSCACPNFAGFLALHLSRPEYASSPYNYMIPIDIGTAGTDPDSGFGIIVAYADVFESDNTSAKATALGSASATSTPHVLAPANDVDWYSFTLSAAGDVDIETTGTSGNTKVTLFNSALTQLGSDDDSGAGQFSKLTSPFLPAGNYFIRVEEPTQADVVVYDLVLIITRDVPGQVSLLSPSDGASGVSMPVGLSWTQATSLATVGYEVEVAADAGFSNIIQTVTGVTGTSTVITGVSGSTIYWWRVRAANPYGSGPWSSVRSFTTAAAAGGGGPGSGGDDGDDAGCSTEFSKGGSALFAVLAALFMLLLRSARRTD